MDPRPYTYQFRKPRLSNPTFQSGHLYESIYHMGSYGRMQPNTQKIHNKPAYELPSNRGNSQKQSQYDALINDRMRQIDPRADDLNNKNDKIQNYTNNRSDYQPKQKYEPEKGPNGHDNFKSQRLDAPIDNGYNDSKAEPPKYNHEERSNYSDRDRFNQRSYSQEVSTQNRSGYKETGYMSGYGDKLMRPMPGRDQDRVYHNQQKPYNIISCYPNQPGVHHPFPKLTLENKLIETGQYYGQQQSRSYYNPEKY